MATKPYLQTGQYADIVSHKILEQNTMRCNLGGVILDYIRDFFIFKGIAYADLKVLKPVKGDHYLVRIECHRRDESTVYFLKLDKKFRLYNNRKQRFIVFAKALQQQQQITDDEYQQYFSKLRKKAVGTPIEITNLASCALGSVRYTGICDFLRFKGIVKARATLLLNDGLKNRILIECDNGKNNLAIS